MGRRIMKNANMENFPALIELFFLYGMAVDLGRQNRVKKGMGLQVLEILEGMDISS